MEDGVNGPATSTEANDHLNNGVAPSSMANFPEGTVADTKEDNRNGTEPSRVNGDNFELDDDSCSNESDALVIDESGPKQRKVRRKKRNHRPKVVSDETSNNSEAIPLPHSNPYFNESLFELTRQHQDVKDDNSKPKNKTGKRKPKPKLKEYAQYLGLQPTVQFKCSKCGQAGFDSLHTLQEHLVQCNSVQNIGNKSPNGDASCSGFKLTRRVFLCSACGTYYENWNLYMHMLEFHRRYICLYCLGMFSMLDDLCQHIQSRHNLEPGRKNTLDEFFNTYSEPCYVVCCECNKLFNEQDNFFYHNCVGNKKKPKTIKQHILPENHVTGDSIAEMLTESNHNNEETAPQEKKETKQEEEEIKLDKESAMETEEHCESLTENDKQIESEQPTENNTEEREEQKEEEYSKEPEENTAMDVSNNEMDLSDKEPENSIESFLENSSEDNKTIESENKTTEELTEPIETRKVPKLSLKLPKSFALTEPEVESDDSEKLTLEVDQIESENENEPEIETEEIPMEDKSIETDKNEESTLENVDAPDFVDSQLQVADKDIPIVEIELEQPLDKIDVRVLLQKCLKATALSCIYCNHARKIAVNGKQLGLHAIAEHRYSSIVKSITAEELIPESFNTRIRECLDDLCSVFFNLDSGASDEAVTFSHLFECFQCHYSTTVHKELYLHNRKFHSKNLLLCIMCKSNFYSYSELICHLCPGLYILDYDLQFRCCMCVGDDLPSAFRLMVHLRKRHNVCDVCLEMCHNQYRLSNHVWKHKLHHFCYRCGIAYRNKPDITRHLFWKHGTESVLCKKCLQKKWPHVYHFCVPPNSFTCEECGLILTRAVSLKVHKRLHTNETKHECTFEGCTERFISNKLMMKHERRHREPSEEIKEEVKEEKEEEAPVETKEEVEKKEEVPKPKPKIDVYDLPELNLSESDSSDSEPETNKKSDEHTPEVKLEEKILVDEKTIQEKTTQEHVEEDKSVFENDVTDTLTKEEQDSSNAVIQNIWDNFKNYQASKEKLDHMFAEPEKIPEPIIDIPIPIVEEPLTAEIALRDHDYCAPEQKTDASIIEVKPALTLTERVDHDYCFHKEEGVTAEKPPLEEKPSEEVKKPQSSSSSSESDSSCTCGSNCSCSSSTGSSSSSSDSSDSDSSTEEGRQRQQVRRQKRREKNKEENKKSVVKDQVTAPVEITINESDLETLESETDEEFYDREPQKIAKKLLEEKRAKLVAELGPNGSFIESRPPTPPVEETPKPKKKKLKKRKKKKEKKASRDYPPITLSIKTGASPKSSPMRTPGTPPVVATTTAAYQKAEPQAATTRHDSGDSSLRASKRRRVPNKFYGYSSDEEEKKGTAAGSAKWRKVEATQAAPRSPLTVPPITIKTGPPQSPRPTVEPISIRLPPTSHPGDFKVKQRPKIPPIRLLSPKPPPRIDPESETDTNESDVDQMEQAPAPAAPHPNAAAAAATPAAAASGLPKPAQPQLYCYCRCPYDEVSEMIGCDSSECEIEWFHFECVGIMVPPKGQWFCPDCRKRKQQRAMMAP